MFSKIFLSHIKGFALKIAWQQRQERTLQPLNVNLSKYEDEKKELLEAEEQWDELPDVAYYASCIMIAVWEGVRNPIAEARGLHQFP